MVIQTKYNIDVDFKNLSMFHYLKILIVVKYISQNLSSLIIK